MGSLRWLDGWRLVRGGNGSLIIADVDMLYRGPARVAVNTGNIRRFELVPVTDVLALLGGRARGDRRAPEAASTRRRLGVVAPMSEHEQPEQLSRADLRKFSPREIRDALREGRLVELLSGRPREPGPPPLDPDEVERAYREGRLTELLRRHREWEPSTRERLRSMTPEAVRDALHAGELNSLLRGEE